MACRHLTIQFLESGHVEYWFFRHHSKYKMSRYRIDWPADDLEILGGQSLDEDNYRVCKPHPASITLEWDKIVEQNTGREVHYIKKNYLRKISGSPSIWKYEETFSIKPDFSLHLHGPNQNMSAIKAKSSAVFHGRDGSVKHYRPRELTEVFFREIRGELHVKWELEINDKPWK